MPIEVCVLHQTGDANVIHNHEQMAVQTGINMQALATVIDCARAHIEDIETGLQDGTYEASDNPSLPSKKRDLEDIQTWHRTAALGRSKESTFKGIRAELKRTDREIERNRNAESRLQRDAARRAQSQTYQPIPLPIS